MLLFRFCYGFVFVSFGFCFDVGWVLFCLFWVLLRFCYGFCLFFVLVLFVLTLLRFWFGCFGFIVVLCDFFVSVLVLVWFVLTSLLFGLVWFRLGFSFCLVCFGFVMLWFGLFFDLVLFSLFCFAFCFCSSPLCCGWFLCEVSLYSHCFFAGSIVVCFSGFDVFCVFWFDFCSVFCASYRFEFFCFTFKHDIYTVTILVKNWIPNTCSWYVDVLLIQGFWDPVGFTADGDVSAFKRRRSVELKHGRISMMATMGSSAVCVSVAWCSMDSWRYLHTTCKNCSQTKFVRVSQRFCVWKASKTEATSPLRSLASCFGLSVCLIDQMFVRSNHIAV